MKRKRKSPFIRYFDKTPPGIVCPHYYLLAHANGCPYECAYCYLSLTFRQKKCEWFTNLGDMEGDLRAWLFGVGELADSLAIDSTWFQVAYRLFTGPANPIGHTLLLVTKSEATELLEYEPHPSVVVSFSVNAESMASKHERGAPSPKLRLDAAAELKRRGWRIRLRLDPMLPCSNWREAYLPTVKRIAEIQPERVTLGSLRYFPSLPRYHPDFPSMPVKRDGPDGRYRLPYSLRIEMYEFVREHLNMPFGLCKETDALHAAVKPDPRCNCTL